MSEQASYTTSIQIEEPMPETYAQNVSSAANIEDNPRMKILRQAVEIAAQDLGGDVADRITDYDGVERRVLMAIRTKEYPRGVGIDVENGRVVYRYDAYDPRGGGEKWAKTISSAVNQNYAVIAVMMAHEELGYRVEVRSARSGAGLGKNVVVTGRI